MNDDWNTVLRSCLIVEGFLCGYLFLFGSQGLRNNLHCKQEQNTLLIQATELEQRLELLNQEVAQWSEDRFLKEQFAREQLGMAYPDELIYEVSEAETNQKSESV